MRPAGSIIQTLSGSSTPMLMAISVIPQRFVRRHGYTLKRMLKKETTKRHAMGLHLTADPTVIFKDLNLVKTEDDLRDEFGRIKNLSFFRSFTDADIWELIRACTWQYYPIGTYVIKEGEFDHWLHIVFSGVLAIETNGRDVDHLQEGDCFGAMGWLACAQRTANVVTKTDVSLMKVNASTLDRAANDTQLRFLKAFVKSL
tara:strand:- start:288 stop:890 length:603 start_codon:yes stop_codon:yes gene_type:complete